MSWWITCYLNYKEICLISQSTLNTEPEILLITQTVGGCHHKSAKQCFDEGHKKTGAEYFYTDTL